MPRRVGVVPRPDVTDAACDDLAARLRAVDWSHLEHAYGPADDVPALLLAVMVGADDVRADAWWELWANVHHQGTVYSATTPTVPFVSAIVRQVSHPDRVDALAFLHAVAVGEGPDAGQVSRVVQDQARFLVPSWRQEPELVRRALLWLLSACPELPVEPDLLRLVPDTCVPVWQAVRDAGGDIGELDEDELDRYDELEQWALAGWTVEP